MIFTEQSRPDASAAFGPGKFVGVTFAVRALKTETGSAFHARLPLHSTGLGIRTGAERKTEQDDQNKKKPVSSMVRLSDQRWVRVVWAAKLVKVQNIRQMGFPATPANNTVKFKN